jgi:transcriptional regulator with XRE-family HTH domain
MPRPSEPVLAWLRDLLATRGINTAELAKKSGVARPRLRRVLLGSEPMLVDELMAITGALQVSPADLPADAVPRASTEDPTPAAMQITGLDPWGNQPEQLFKVAFALGCDLLFTAEAALLQESGIPAYVLQQYRDAQIPVELDAAFHGHNAPRYDETGVTLTLSFDALYDCRFPWASIRRMVFSPTVPEPVEAPAPEPEPVKGRPRLRLVD